MCSFNTTITGFEEKNTIQFNLIRATTTHLRVKMETEPTSSSHLSPIIRIEKKIVFK